MPLPNPMEQYIPLSEAELVHKLAIYTLLNNKWLPISRRGIDREERAKLNGRSERHWRVV